MILRHALTLSFFASALSLCLPFGCANTASCGPGERLKSGLCLPAGSGSSSPVTTSDAGPGDGSAGEGGPPKKTGAFGADCLTNADCGDPAPVCAIQPTDAKGFCSQIDCAKDPSVCPSGYQCFDPSVINPDWPTICVPAN